MYSIHIQCIYSAYKSQLSLLSLGSQVGHEHVAHFVGRFGQEVAHAVGADALADDVEVEAIISALACVQEGRVEERERGEHTHSR